MISRAKRPLENMVKYGLRMAVNPDRKFTLKYMTPNLISLATTDKEKIILSMSTTLDGHERSFNDFIIMLWRLAQLHHMSDDEQMEIAISKSVLEMILEKGDKK